MICCFASHQSSPVRCFIHNTVWPFYNKFERMTISMVFSVFVFTLASGTWRRTKTRQFVFNVYLLHLLCRHIGLWIIFRRCLFIGTSHIETEVCMTNCYPVRWTDAVSHKTGNGWAIIQVWNEYWFNNFDVNLTVMHS